MVNNKANKANKANKRWTSPLKAFERMAVNPPTVSKGQRKGAKEVVASE